jgi:hypothetical protein
MMYYDPGMSAWGMSFMIIGNLVLWGLLIFGAVLVDRYVWRIRQLPPHRLSFRHSRSRHNGSPAARSTSRSTSISCRSNPAVRPKFPNSSAVPPICDL